MFWRYAFSLIGCSGKVMAKHLTSRFLHVIVIGALCYQAVGCQGRTVQQMTSDQDKRGNPILAIYTDAKYSVYPPGRRLNLIVFSSGAAEYDYYPKQDSGKAFEFERRKITLENNDFNRIKELVGQLSETDIKDHYSPALRMMDAFISVSVSLSDGPKKKNVVLEENHSDLALDKKKGVYPDPLWELLMLVSTIDRDALSPATDKLP
jgi:hypothetical protein